jgi:hypothetical protein
VPGGVSSSANKPVPVTLLIQPPSKRTRIVPFAFSFSSITAITTPTSSTPALSLSISKPERITLRFLQT